MWVFFLVLVVVGAYVVWQNPRMRNLLSGYFPLASSESAAEILKKRYARGEISKEEFEAMKKDLED